MSDLIDRQEAIDTIEREAYRHTYIDQIVDIIKNLPSAQPEPSQVARDIATIIENEKDMRVIAHPTFTEAEIQRMQELDSAQIQKAYEVGYEEGKKERTHCGDCKFGDWYDDLCGHRRCYCMEFGCGGFTAEDFCSRGKPYGGESE